MSIQRVQLTVLRPIPTVLRLTLLFKYRQRRPGGVDVYGMLVKQALLNTILEVFNGVPPSGCIPREE